MAYNLAMATLVGVMDAAALDAKQEKLFETLTGLDRVIVAYSGGTDSAYLAWAAHRVLGNNAIAVTADSASIPERRSDSIENRSMDQLSRSYSMVVCKRMFFISHLSLGTS